MLSSFSGIIEEIPGISVDNFETIGKRAFFLSHCHTDHTVGLSDSKLLRYLRENNVFIYTSEVNSKILQYEVNDISNYVLPMKLGESQIITLPADPDKNYVETHLKVTLIPAGHCLGSSMFLFEANEKKVLYTGDFRLDPSDISKIRDFHNAGNRTVPIKLDALYVDTTFLYHTEDFPNRSESVECLLKEIRKWLNVSNSNKIALHTSAKYGYEFVFNEIYKKLDKKVYIKDEKWKLYRTMLDSVYGVTNDTREDNIHLCHRWHNVSHDKCFSNEYKNTNFKYLYIHLHAKTFDYNLDEIPFNYSDNKLKVCFATHCSRNELLYFISYFSPKKIVGFPNVYVATLYEEPLVNVEFVPVKKKRFNKLKENRY